jgi:hypothetical protein
VFQARLKGSRSKEASSFFLHLPVPLVSGTTLKVFSHEVPVEMAMGEQRLGWNR